MASSVVASNKFLLLKFDIRYLTTDYNQDKAQAARRMKILQRRLHTSVNLLNQKVFGALLSLIEKFSKMSHGDIFREITSPRLHELGARMCALRTSARL